MTSRKRLLTDLTSPRWKKVKNETFYYNIAELNVVQKKIQNGDISFFSAYIISVYVSFIIAKNCGFVMGFEILAIYFPLKNSYLLLYLM